MQKIDFSLALRHVTEELSSKTIVSLFDEGFSQPGKEYNYGIILPILFSSKANFDKLMGIEEYGQIIKHLEGSNLYDSKVLADLSRSLTARSAASLLNYSQAAIFYNFHKSLLSTLRLVDNVLVKKNVTSAISNSGSDGLVIFQIHVPGEGLETERYIRILSALKELANVIAKLHSEETQSEIVLLDSGSDSNIGLKTGVETAKSIFLVFKEIWDYVLNHKYYKEKLRNSALLESLSVRQKIAEQRKAGVITEEEEKEYAHLIKSRVDQLIGNNVLPKQIVIEDNLIENQKLLESLKDTRLLGSSPDQQNLLN